MSKAVSNYAHGEKNGAFYVAAPHLGDSVGGALHRAYDDHHKLPDDMLDMLRCLNRID